MRIGILTGGGDAPGTNAVIRALVLALARHGGIEAWGIEDGYLGLMERRLRPLTPGEVDGVVALGGTLLGSSNRASPLAHRGADRTAEVLACAAAHGLAGIVAIGGDGTLSIADALHRAGLPHVGVPKTIDNDIPGVELSFGFDTAVARVAEALDEIRTTAQSMRRVMLVETMGRHAGWIALHGGLAGAADMILLPELPFAFDAVVAHCRAREARERHAVVCVAEGAHPVGGAQVLRQRVEGAPEPERLGGIAEQLAQALAPRLQGEVRAVVLGHVQRGGTPTAADRVLGTAYGAAAAELVVEAAWGQRLVHARGGIERAPLAGAAAGQRRVAPDDPVLRVARATGVSLGQPAAEPR